MYLVFCVFMIRPTLFSSFFNTSNDLMLSENYYPTQYYLQKLGDLTQYLEYGNTNLSVLLYRNFVVMIQHNREQSQIDMVQAYPLAILQN